MGQAFTKIFKKTILEEGKESWSKNNKERNGELDAINYSYLNSLLSQLLHLYPARRFTSCNNTF